MIIFLGIFDLVTVILAISSIFFSMYKGTTTLVLAILAFKGFWSLGKGNAPFNLLGLIDIVSSAAIFLTLEFGLYSRLSIVMLCLLGWKSVMSIKPF